jgi:hypothetical protein
MLRNGRPKNGMQYDAASVAQTPLPSGPHKANLQFSQNKSRSQNTNITSYNP